MELATLLLKSALSISEDDCEAVKKACEPCYGNGTKLGLTGNTTLNETNMYFDPNDLSYIERHFDKNKKGFCAVPLSGKKCPTRGGGVFSYKGNMAIKNCELHREQNFQNIQKERGCQAKTQKGRF